jgi:glucuronoxylan 4-O-methyltransferase
MEWSNLQSSLLKDLMIQVQDTQMTYYEYKFISDTVHELNGANFLVFGTGRDSKLWINSNNNGRTVFLEPDSKWAEIAAKDNPTSEIHHISYDTRPEEALNLFFEYKKFGVFPKIPYIHENIVNTEWDVILIDSPVGSVNGRMCSIYLANELASKTFRNTHIFLHDSHRDIETLYGHLFLFPNSKIVEEYNSNTNEFTKLNYYMK